MLVVGVIRYFVRITWCFSVRLFVSTCFWSKIFIGWVELFLFVVSFVSMGTPKTKQKKRKIADMMSCHIMTLFIHLIYINIWSNLILVCVGRIYECKSNSIYGYFFQFGYRKKVRYFTQFCPVYLVLKYNFLNIKLVWLIINKQQTEKTPF